MERDISGGRCEIPVIVTAAVALTSLATLVAGCLRQFLCFRIQKLIQRFLDASPD